MKPPTMHSGRTEDRDPSAEAAGPSADVTPARKPYVAPALVAVAAFESVTLGTKPGHAPGHGC